MMADSVRMDAYERALRRVVRPGSVVVDIGTGTGILALLACSLGARRVYAIEPDNAIGVAQEAARAGGYADRIRFIQERSTDVCLPERADVVVSDLRGVLPLFQQHIPAVIDARRRFLLPGGALVPLSDALYAAVVEAPELYQSVVSPWTDNPCGIDMSAGLRVAVNNWRKGRVRPEQMLVPPRRWATLDYSAIEDCNVSAQTNWTAERAGVAHGIAVWFDSVLAEDVGFSNAPDAPELIYGSAFFPLTRPVELASGDALTVRLHANLVGGDYVWRWESHAAGRGEPSHVRADFRQSSFHGVPLSPALLRKRAAAYAPALGEEGRIDHFALSLMGGESTVEEIARRLVERFPSRFMNPHEALTRVGELSQKYSR